MGRRRRAAVAAALCLVAALARPAAGANDATATEDTITITVKVDFANASPSLARRWGRVFERYFNDGPGLGGFDSCGREVEFVADVQSVLPGEPRADAHLVYVEDLRSGVDMISSVDWGDDDFYPAEHNAVGHWEGDIDEATIAHEFGHLLGLDDAYEAEVGEDGERDVDDPTHALPNHRGELMADNGSVTQAYIDQVVSAHTRDLNLGCERWEGILEGEGRNVPATRCEPAANYDYTFVITVQPDGAAVMDGEGTTSHINGCGSVTTHNRFTLQGGKAGSRFTFSGPFPGPFTLRISGDIAQGPGRGMLGALRWDLDITAQCEDCD